MFLRWQLLDALQQGEKDWRVLRFYTDTVIKHKWCHFTKTQQWFLYISLPILTNFANDRDQIDLEYRWKVCSASFLPTILKKICVQFFQGVFNINVLIVQLVLLCHIRKTIISPTHFIDQPSKIDYTICIRLTVIFLNGSWAFWGFHKAAAAEAELMMWGWIVTCMVLAKFILMKLNVKCKSK